MKLDPRRTALLVIDLQNDTVGENGAFASSGAAAFATEHGVVERAAGLAGAFRRAGAPVIHVWHVDEPGHVDSTRNAELYRSIADADALVRGTWGAGPVVVPEAGDLVVEKQRMSSFNSTTLDTKLRASARRRSSAVARGRTGPSSTPAATPPTTATRWSS